MSDYICVKCGEGGLNQYGHGKIDGSFSCDNKPEPKKEKTMTTPLFWSAGSVEWKYEEMSDYWDLCKNGGHVFQTLGQWKPWGEALPEYCLRCSEKKPEPKKEKQTAKIEIDTHLFDGLTRQQRIGAMVEIEAAITKATDLRVGDEAIALKLGENGAFTARYVIEEALKKVLVNLIDSTVEKFGGDK